MYPGYPLFFSILGGLLIEWIGHPLDQLVYLIFLKQPRDHNVELSRCNTHNHSNQVLVLPYEQLFISWVFDETPEKGHAFSLYGRGRSFS